MTQTQAPVDHFVPTARVRRPVPCGGEEGGALVELSVSLPIILLLITGIFAVSITLYQKLSLAEGVSAGARTLAADRGNTLPNGTLDPCYDAVQAVYKAAPSLNQSSLSFSFLIGGVTTTGTSCVGTVLTPNGESGQIQATYPCTIKMYGLNFSSCTLSSTVAEEIQ